MSKQEELNKRALEYHEEPQPGKIEVVPTKSCKTQDDLSLAYTPGVAVPCKEIEANPDLSYRYTSRGNLVGVISNGTAVLGLGNIGALASKPVMEGKGVLFKRFADVDAFDIEVDELDPKKFVEVVSTLGPTFGGINLEDIKSPDCFYIEDTLKATMDIPVFHDDQHGTAIVALSGLINAMSITGRDKESCQIVVNGAGSAGISITRFLLTYGFKNIMLCDKIGILAKGMDGLNPMQEKMVEVTNLSGKRGSLLDALQGADIFIGVSAANIMTDEMVLAMNADPIIFALANPNPEITYDKAISIRKDIIMATGRSDYPNQINNVLGFPFIFRGALDVRAREINDQMKLAASHALASLARLPVTDEVKKAYNDDNLAFGRNYIIAKPYDKRAFIEVSVAVAKTAVETGVARVTSFDEASYRAELDRRYNEKISRFM